MISFMLNKESILEEGISMLTSKFVVVFSESVYLTVFISNLQSTKFRKTMCTCSTACES
jgi:hypothetical protein